MGSGQASTIEVRNPGVYQISVGLRSVLIVLVVVGMGTFGAALAKDPTRAWASFVHNHFYFMSLALGGIFFASIQWLTGAMWSATVRRIAESFTAYLPIVLMTAGALYFGMHSLYSWSDASHVIGDKILEGKSGYLAPKFFLIRNLIAVLIWIVMARKMVGNSLAQDGTKDFAYTLKNRILAPLFIAVFTISFTMASFDQLMSLDPHWFSTMYGVYCFAGLFYSTLALIAVVVVLLQRTGKLAGLVTADHLHDLGKFMFAFSVFWAYIAFSQFMLIWYANQPEETGYYLERLKHGWAAVSLFLLLGKFLTPFFLLLPRDSKRNPSMLLGVGLFMLVAQWVDVLWLVQPNLNPFKEGPVVGWIELGVAAGFIGVFGLVVARFLGQNNIVAIGDPRLSETLAHHQ